MNDRLYRSHDDRMLAGVAAGLAEYWDADPSLIRIVWVLLAILTGGIALVVYIVMAIVVPEGDDTFYPMTPGLPGMTAGWPGSADPGGPPPGPGTSATDASGAAPAPMPTSPWPTPPTPAGSWPSSYPMDPRSARRAARAARRAVHREHHNGTGAVMVGIIFVLLGGFFLAREWIPQLDFDWFWPVILIAIGIVVLAGAFARPRSQDGIR